MTAKQNAVKGVDFLWLFPMALRKAFKASEMVSLFDDTNSRLELTLRSMLVVEKWIKR
jgi:hypothetical protein